MTDKQRVYLDYAATTPLHPEVRDEISESLGVFGNPSSVHEFGRDAHRRVESARNAAAKLVGAEPESMVFTGGGSESNNTVLKMVTCGESVCVDCPVDRREIVTSVVEHPSVLNTVEVLEGQGIRTRYVGVDETGRIKWDDLERSITENTALVSIMLANNEIGTIQDISRITEYAHSKGAVVHTDAVQAVGKIPVDVTELGVDFLSFSAHKFCGPKGIGVLYVRKGAPYCTLIHGGHQEEGRRAGTLNTWGIIGLGKAAEVATRDLEADIKRISELKSILRTGITASVPDIHINGNDEHVLPGTLNVSFKGAEGESILLYLDFEGIAVSTGSACASGSLDPSHVLLATGIGAELAHGSIRFSLGQFTTAEEIEYVLAKVPPVIAKIRSMSTVYQSKGGAA